jgi:hypothetical protein
MSCTGMVRETNQELYETLNLGTFGQGQMSVTESSTTQGILL